MDAPHLAGRPISTLVSALPHCVPGNACGKMLLMTARKRNFNIRRAARRTGFSVGYISRVMRGQRNPSFSAAQRIAHEMGCSTDALAKEIERRKAAGVSSELSDKIRTGLRVRRRIDALRAELELVDASE